MMVLFSSFLKLDFLLLFLALCPDLMAERPQEHEGLNNIIVVDNLPKVDQQKLEKLKAVISKVYSKSGVCRNEYYPLDEEGKTKG
jgi:translation initiation factor 3 subunit B